MTARTVHVVPHTHWDREWYEPFQVFRARLVDVLDDVVPRLERGDLGGHFLLDGQVAAVDDYLEMRPAMEHRLRALVQQGRLAIGPWYVLPDEFLVSGETIVRDLQLGLQRGDDLGGAMPVGYLPDMFGHVAQMPQLLRLAGLTDAVVWRGVPSTVRTTGFVWASPDGSHVHATYLPRGYSNGAHMPARPGDFVRDVTRFVDEQADVIQDPVLWLIGDDHAAPPPHLVEVLERANAMQRELEFEIVPLRVHLDAQRRRTGETSTVHCGELRSGARANLLMGVTSNRVDVRTAAAGAEVALERVAEPMCALFTEPSRWPARELELAWREVIRNAAHDSVCACSADEVVEAVLHRYAEARQIAATLVDRARYWFGCSFADTGTAVCNTVGRSRRALVEHPSASGGTTVSSVEVPPFGWVLVRAGHEDGTPPVRVEDDGRDDSLLLDNGLTRVTIDRRSGTFAIDGHPGLASLVDSGDVGDTYNWCPPQNDLVVDTPAAVRGHVLHRDRVRVRVAVDRTLAIPSHASGDHRAAPVEGTVRTVVELRAGEPFVRVTVELDNRWRDHRLRLLFPLPNAARESEAECTFTVVRRDLEAEGGPTEMALPTFPAKRFVRAGGLTIAHDAVTEYELVDIRGTGDDRAAHALALTVLRATGMLSRGPMRTRPLPAGPELPTAGSQVQGPIRRQFALQTGDADAFALADAFTPFPTVRAPGGGTRPERGTALRVGGAEVSAIVRSGDRLVIRVHNPHPVATVVAIPGARGDVVDLRDRPLEPFDGSLPLAPWQIATIGLTSVP